MEFRNTRDEYEIEQHFIIGHFKIRYCWLKTKLHLGTLVLSLKFWQEESKEGARAS